MKWSSISNNDNTILLEQIEEKFKIFLNKFIKLKSHLENDRNLQERKMQKQDKLEKLKSSYSTMKKIYENAVRCGVKFV